MRWLIRQIARKGRDGRVHQDHAIEAGRLRIGRGADCEVFLGDLRVALDHATLRPAGDGRFRLRATAPSGFRIDHQVGSGAVLGPGDRFVIGSHELRLVEPPQGCDLLLEVEPLATAGGRELEAGLRERSRLDLAQTGVSKRRWSWGLFVGIFVLFAVIPALGFWLPGVGAVLRGGPLPSDAAWDPGPLAFSHRHFGANCTACHQDAFVQVRNAACVECHRGTAHHVDPDFHAAVDLNQARCAACHRDHKNGRLFVRRDTALCADCHRDLRALAPESSLLDVDGFGSNHPEFRPSLPRPRQGPAVFERAALDAVEAPLETSNLEFPHATHLDPAGIERANGRNRVLRCGNCHLPEPGGLGMAPIRFESHCRDCHRLAFEADDPRRELAHARPDAVLSSLQEYYAARALAGGYPDLQAPAVVRALRRPGVELTPAEREQAMQWVRRTARELAGELIEYRLCASCHRVSADAAGPVPSWRIEPVRLADPWLPKARFSHRRHRTMDCADCHSAGASQTSADVLIPGIDSCRECHGDAENAGAGRIASACTDCHGFHIATGFALGAGND